MCIIHFIICNWVSYMALQCINDSLDTFVHFHCYNIKPGQGTRQAWFKLFNYFWCTNQIQESLCSLLSTGLLAGQHLYFYWSKPFFCESELWGRWERPLVGSQSPFQFIQNERVLICACELLFISFYFFVPSVCTYLYRGMYMWMHAHVLYIGWGWHWMSSLMALHCIVLGACLDSLAGQWITATWLSEPPLALGL